MRKNHGKRRKWFELRRGLQGLCLSIIVSVVYLAMAYAADYPTKAIQFVVPYPPGGPSDVTARLLNKKLSTLLGQPVVVINKTGGVGTIGIQSVVTAPADGYNILISSSSLMVAPLTSKDIPYAFKDFTPINLISDSPVIISVRTDAPWKNLEEMVNEAKKNPGKFIYSSPGPSTIPHLAGELFKMETGTDLTHVPMEGLAKAVMALLGGHADVLFSHMAGLQGHYDAGSLRALGVMSLNRIKELPAVPTTVKMGYPKILCSVWTSIFVSAKTSAAIVTKLGEVVNKALKDKEVIESFEKAGIPILNLGPKDAARFMADDEERVLRIIKVAKIGQ